MLDKGRYGTVRISKDVIFDLPEDIVQQMNAEPSPEPHQSPDHAPIPTQAPHTVPTQPHAEPINLPAPPDVAPASPDAAPHAPDIPTTSDVVNPVNRMQRRTRDQRAVTPAAPVLATPAGAPKRASKPTKPGDHPLHPVIDIDTIGPNTPIVSWENDDAVYWYSMQTMHPESLLTVVETSHYDQIKTLPDPGVPKSFWKAMKDPPRAKAIDTELTKFEVNSCFNIVPYTGQHLVPMMWLFSVKNDGTKKARQIGRAHV